MKDLTIQDKTQVAIMHYLKITERLLGVAATVASGTQRTATIWAMPDLGFPHNVRRIHGGFFTGALYAWDTTVPIVPVDATVNCCGISAFKIAGEIATRGDFNQLVLKAQRKAEESSSYRWNFANGNHFIIYGDVRGSPDMPDGRYLVLHSSASEFKKQHNGLYPSPGNWYSQKMKTLVDPPTNRYLRYIDGSTAERFIQIAQHLEVFNRIRHRYFAELICGDDKIEDEVLNVQHYGMPTSNSVAIGCQSLAPGDLFLLLTAPSRPLYFVRALKDARNLARVAGTALRLYPHGLGKECRTNVCLEFQVSHLLFNGKKLGLEDTLENESDLALRDFSIEECNGLHLPTIVERILERCPGMVVGRLNPIFSYHRSKRSKCPECFA